MARTRASSIAHFGKRSRHLRTVCSETPMCRHASMIDMPPGWTALRKAARRSSASWKLRRLFPLRGGVVSTEGDGTDAYATAPPVDGGGGRCRLGRYRLAGGAVGLHGGPVGEPEHSDGPG